MHNAYFNASIHFTINSSFTQVVILYKNLPVFLVIITIDNVRFYRTKAESGTSLFSQSVSLALLNL